MTVSHSSLPNLIVIGAPKCGTTSLHAYLSEHPQIFMSRQKELHFFLTTVPWGTWGRGLDWYAAQFEEGAHLPVRGESSPGYSLDRFSEDVARHMAEVLPEARIVYLVRDPIERIRSNYTEELYGRRLPPSLSLNDILAAGPEGPGLLGLYHREFVYTSLYWTQIRRFLRYYPPSRVFVATAEALARDRTRVVQDVFSFLGVDRTYVPDNLSERLNRKEGKRLRVVNSTRLVAWMPSYQALSARIPERFKRLYRNAVSVRVDDEKLTEIAPEHLDRLRALYEKDLEELRRAFGVDFSLQESAV